LQKLHSIG